MRSSKLNLRFKEISNLNDKKFKSSVIIKSPKFINSNFESWIIS
jgi:hypothetical protein